MIVGLWVGLGVGGIPNADIEPTSASSAMVINAVAIGDVADICSDEQPAACSELYR